MRIFDYEDVMLLPNKCIVESRTECDTSVKLGKFTFKMPVVPANMKTVVNEKLSIELAKKGYFYVMHRFNFDSYEFVVKMKKMNLVSSISLGVKQDDYNLVDKFKENNVKPDFMTIDIAHGHSDSVCRMIRYIKRRLGRKVFVIAGNIATPEAVRDLENWGADATKIGVGPGKVCITKLKTGFGSGGWQLSNVKWCSKAATKPIIADGGLRVNGDIAKSIRFGATMSMVGSMFAAHEESPGNLVTNDDGVKYKEYFGSASEYNKGEKRYVEGKKDIIKIRGSIWETLRVMQQDLQSSISYSGGNKLSALRSVNFVVLKYSDY